MKISKDFKFIRFFFGSLLNSFKTVMYFLTFKITKKIEKGKFYCDIIKKKFCCKLSEKAQNMAVSLIFCILQSLYLLIVLGLQRAFPLP